MNHRRSARHLGPSAAPADTLKPRLEVLEASVRVLRDELAVLRRQQAGDRGRLARVEEGVAVVRCSLSLAWSRLLGGRLRGPNGSARSEARDGSVDPS